MSTPNIVPQAANEGALGTSTKPWGEVNAAQIKEGGKRVATLASPALTGNPTAPTQSEDDDSTKLATTAYADRAASSAADSRGDVSGSGTTGNVAVFSGAKAITDGPTVAAIRDRSTHTGSQLLSTISDAGDLAAKDTVDTADIEDDAITPAKIANTAVTAGTYSYATITVDAQGRITSASEGSAPGSGPSFTIDDTNTIDLSLDESELSAAVRLKSSGFLSSEGALSSTANGIHGVLGTTANTMAAGNDARFPTAAQKAAFAGPAGYTPSGSNTFVTDDDVRLNWFDEDELASPADDDKVAVYDLSTGDVGWMARSEFASESGATEFVGLEDAPDDYTDAALKLVRVNGTEDALEFFTGSYASNDTTLTAGDGLTGGGDLSDDRSFAVSTKNSIEIDADSLQLEGDEDTPGNDQYYGTNDSGTKGYHDLPTSEGGGDQILGTYIARKSTESVAIGTLYPAIKVPVAFTVTKVIFSTHDNPNEYAPGHWKLKNGATTLASSDSNDETVSVTPESAISIAAGVELTIGFIDDDTVGLSALSGAQVTLIGTYA